jgi:hypothetical protein
MRVLFPLLLIACAGPDEDSSTVPSGPAASCDPVAPTVCGLPFPSTYHMVEDSSTGSGWRVAFAEDTLPINANGYQPSPFFYNELDGWSVLTPMLAHFGDVSLDGLSGHDDLGGSIADDSLSIVVDADTGERIPHFVERDISVEDSDRSLLMIRPVAPMEYGHRYVVGLRGLVDPQGAAIESSSAFVELRDDTPSSDADVERRRTVYDEVIFPTLEKEGWDRSEITLAWDFVTGSQQGITGRPQWLRDDALSRFSSGDPTYTIVSTEEAPNEHTAFRIYGEFSAPLYMEADDSGTVLTRDDEGQPFYNGETTVGFSMVVPNSVVESGEPAAIVQYGHGLLGSRSEVHNGYLAEMADRYGWILIASDWTGMSDDDVGDITLMLVDELDRFSIIPERSLQGFVEKLWLMRLAMGPLADEPLLQHTHVETGESHSLIDTERRYYYGNSQGAILGGGYLGLSPDIERAALGVGGTPYNLLLTRSYDFEPFFLVFKAMYPDPAEISLWLGLIQSIWDPAESSGYTPALTREPIEGSSDKEILIQVAIGDAQVTTLGAEVMARAYDARMLAPTAREVWGLETVEESWEGSALVEFDYGLTEPFTNTPPDIDSDPHESPRRDRAGQDQIDHFFRTGVVLQTCTGICGETR